MNDLKVSDIMCKWYIWAVVGYVIGKNLSDTLGGLIGLAIGGLIALAGHRAAILFNRKLSKKLDDN